MHLIIVCQIARFCTSSVEMLLRLAQCVFLVRGDIHVLFKGDWKRCRIDCASVDLSDVTLDRKKYKEVSKVNFVVRPELEFILAQMVKHPVLQFRSILRTSPFMSDDFQDMIVLAKVRLKPTFVKFLLAETKQGSDNVVCLNALETL